jgi:hypothetical protein
VTNAVAPAFSRGVYDANAKYACSGSTFASTWSRTSNAASSSFPCGTAAELTGWIDEAARLISLIQACDATGALGVRLRERGRTPAGP